LLAPPAWVCADESTPGSCTDSLWEPVAEDFAAAFLLLLDVDVVVELFPVEPLLDSDLAASDLPEADLPGVDLPEADLPDADLAEADLARAGVAPESRDAESSASEVEAAAGDGGSDAVSPLMSALPASPSAGRSC
jgi:hypothetical protein